MGFWKTPVRGQPPREHYFGGWGRRSSLPEMFHFSATFVTVAAKKLFMNGKKNSEGKGETSEVKQKISPTPPKLQIGSDWRSTLPYLLKLYLTRGTARRKNVESLQGRSALFVFCSRLPDETFCGG